MRGKLFVVSGPSGVGKNTLLNAVVARSEHVRYSISATSRAMRPGVVDGKSYYFVTREQFEKLIADDALLEYAEYVGNYYGTPLGKIEERRAAGQDILLEIDIQGALNVMAKCPDGVFIFLLPPSIEELEHRLRGRGSETAESLARRMGNAKKEIGIGRRYKYVVVNDTVDKAVQDIQAILVAEHSRVAANAHLFEELEAE